MKSFGFGIITAGAVIGLAFSGIEPASAASISGLFQTGVDDLGDALSPGSVDSHYSIVETDSNAVTLSSIPGVWTSNTSTSSWIWENADGQPTNVTRTFRTIFDLTGLKASTAAISGLWATDNNGLDILINGVSTAQTNPGFSSFTPFSITSGFIDGINTLDFVVYDYGVISGFHVAEISGTAENSTSVPTPALLPGLIGLGLGVIRRRRAEVA